MNILITENCNRNCQFCFAKERVSKSKFDSVHSDAKTDDSDFRYMSMERLESIMDMLEKAGEMQLRLLGGEPTLHPEFLKIVETAVSRGFGIQLFSNLIMSPETVDQLASYPPEKINILANVTPEKSDTERMKQRARYALEKLHKSIVVSLTITSPDFEYDFLIDYIEQYDLKRSIRVGVGMPIVGIENQYLPTSQYKAAGTAIASMARECIKSDILLGFDCGMVMCMFTEEEMGVITNNTQGLNIVCSPIVDIGVTGQIWHCFPLSQVLNMHMDQFSERRHMAAAYAKIIEPYAAIGCMNECLTCDYKRRNQCNGGCIAHNMKNMNRQPPLFVEEMKLEKVLEGIVR